MVAASSLRKRLRKLPQAMPEPSFWLVSILPCGTEADHYSGEPWPTEAYLNRDQRAPEMVLKLNMGEV